MQLWSRPTLGIEMDNVERKMMFMFTAINGEISPTSSCSYKIKYSHEVTSNHPIGISCMKDGYECWWKSKEDILFDYLTRRM